jgi:FAD/FMN-containing dehydrogenase
MSITRRQFLRGSAQLVLGAGVSVGLRSRAAARVPTDGASARAWLELARRLSGPVLRPGDPGYAAIAQPNNLRFGSVLPWGIARCESADDVAQSVLWSREVGVPLAARGGGHSYAGYSTTRGLLIDLSLMNRVEFDTATGIVTVGGGARNGLLYAALRQQGVAITHGRCPGVGVGGFFLGGGIGFNMRARGLACDQLVGTELVTADGRRLTVDDGEHADLFWACRGGAGGNFGINTAFSVQTFPVRDLTAFRITWFARPREVYAALLAALDAAPPRLGSRVQITARTPRQVSFGGDVAIVLLGQLQGTSDELREILGPVYAVATPLSETILTTDYWDAQVNFLAEPGPPGFYQERSRFFAGPLGAEAIDTAFFWARQVPTTTLGAFMVLFQTGAAVNALAPDATAFVHRGSAWLMTIALDWGADDPPDLVEQNRAWQDMFYDAMLPFASAESYQNFPDPSLADWPQAYYGDNLPRLRLVKAAVDPAGVFRYPQGIPPA